jgi:hypothetical protein
MGDVADHDRTDRPWTAQGPPQPVEGPIIQQLVIDDLEARGWADVSADVRERWEFGRRKYGNDGLRPGDGRNTIADCYEECEDLAIYLKQAIVEGEEGLDDAYQFALTMARLLRRRLASPNQPSAG